MGEVLHLWALAPATVGACCVAADRGRARVPEFAAAVLMLLAMADAATGAGLIAPVFWAALMLVAAMLLAVARGARRSPRSRRSAGERMPHPSRAMTVMTALGLVTMAVLMIAMTGHAAGLGGGVGGGALAGSVGAHGHGGGGSGTAWSVAVAAVAIVYVVASALAAVRTGIRLDRLQYASMSAATALMSLALLS